MDATLIDYQTHLKARGLRPATITAGVTDL